MTKLTDIPGAGELPYLDIKDLYDEVCRRAEDKMLKTGKLEGAHYNALKQILAEHGNSTIHLEVDVEAMADCIFSKYSDCADIRIAEHLSTNIPKWAKLVRR